MHGVELAIPRSHRAPRKKKFAPGIYGGGLVTKQYTSLPKNSMRDESTDGVEWGQSLDDLALALGCFAPSPLDLLCKAEEEANGDDIHEALSIGLSGREELALSLMNRSRSTPVSQRATICGTRLFDESSMVPIVPRLIEVRRPFFTRIRVKGGRLERKYVGLWPYNISIEVRRRSRSV